MNYISIHKNRRRYNIPYPIPGRKAFICLFLLIISSTLAAFGNNNPSQDGTLSLNMQNVTVERVLNQIETETDYTFLYNKQMVDVTRKVSITVKNKPIKIVLASLFDGSGVSYSIEGKQIVLSKEEQKTRSQNSHRISGTVVDAVGEAIIGATVIVKGTSNGTATDINGEFKLTAPSGGTLSVSYIGYVPQELKIGNKTVFNITLNEDTKTLEEVVVVGFGKQKKESVIGAIQSVKSEDIKLPTTNLSNTFAGRIAGIISVQKSGEPGADGANFWIRGVGTFASAQSPLILIDGTESSSYDLNALAPEVIESFSVLKDATATALYGSRGANGVMLVTTKSGQLGGKPTINIRIEGRMSMPTQIPKIADAYTYMNMFNEAVEARTPGAAPIFSDDQINGVKNHLDPYMYPNIDWYGEMFKDVTYDQAVNLNVSGGGNRMDYFISATFNNDMGMVKTSNDNPFKNNISNLRYSFQSNVNAHITKTTKVGVKLNMQIQDYKGPSNSISYIFNRVMWAPPALYPIKFPNIPGTNYSAYGNKSGGPQNDRYANPYAELSAGIEERFRTTAMAAFTFDQDLKFITPGLKVSALFSLKNFSSTTCSRTFVPSYFQIDPNAFGIEQPEGEYPYVLKAVNDNGTNAITAKNSSSGDRLLNTNISINYERKFLKVHDVAAQLVYLQRGYYKNTPGSASYNDALGERNQGLAGRLTYDFDKRYFFEFNFGYSGSDNFVKGKQFGFFPSYALGYIISNENFFAPLTDVVSLLKIRGSYGTVGNSASSIRFPGITNVTMNGAGYAFGENFQKTPNGAIVSAYGNENATWEVAKKTNVGIELGLFDQKVLLIADYFYENRNSILMQRKSVAATTGIGGATALANIGRVKNQGIDMSLEYNHAFRKDVILSVKGNLTYAVNELVDKDEPFYKWDYQYEKGGPLNRIGPAYIADGLFKDENDIKTSKDQSAVMPNIKPGDIKYKDLNNDGIINEYDRKYIGDPYIPQIIYGFGGSLQYKKWDFSVFFQGAAKVSIYLDNIHPFGTYYSNVLQFVADDYWSESNPNPNASYPRLAHTVGAENTNQKSTFWLRSGAFLRLKNAEIGFNHKFMRIYLSGSNLLTFTGFKYWDPEIGGSNNGSDSNGNGLVYPLQRVINLGIQFKF